MSGRPSRRLALVTTPAPIPCVFPPWLRELASQRPIAVRWDALAFAYDGSTVYVRLLDLPGKPVAWKQSRCELTS